MVDIETFGTKPGSIILNIGAVAFDIETGKTGSIFSKDIDMKSSEKAGLTLDLDTVKWWLSQPKDAQKEINQHKGGELKNVLIQFAMWIRDNCPNDVQVWGNSARFDFGIIEAAYDVVGLEKPWNHFNERDVRTIVSFGKEIKDNMPFIGIKHYAIDDCKHQIKYCSEIYIQKIQNDKSL